MNFESESTLVNVLFSMSLTVLFYRNSKTCKYTNISSIYFQLFRVYLKSYCKETERKEHIQQYCLYCEIAQILHATGLP